MSKMAGDYQMYKIEKRLDEITDLLSEVLRRLGKLEYSGTIKSSDGMSPFGGKSMSVDISLEKKNRWDRLGSTNVPKLEKKKKKKVKKQFHKTDIHGNKI